MKYSLLLIPVLMGVPAIAQLWKNDFRLYTVCVHIGESPVERCKSAFLFKEVERFERKYDEE